MAQFEGRQVSATQRKLTTIFSADVQGYSRLMEADEEGTLATLKQYRDAMARLIASHGGRVVNTWGDGLIAEFPSVVEAVRAAVDVQNELGEHNEGRPTESRMLFRIGINLGDVIVEGDDIYGDGVNIAARLQTQAAPGGVVISSTVYDQVRNKVPVGFEFLGNLSVKNIEEGVPSYAVKVGESSLETAPRPTPATHFGRNPAPPPAATQIPEVNAPGIMANLALPRLFGVLGVIGIALIAINLFSWHGVFWARWPLFAFAMIVLLASVKRGQFGDRSIASLAVIGLGLVAINLISWSGEFWARWPLLGLAIVAAIRWVTRRGDNPAR
ncbi:adenylate/guanylate cyclase domain-containing protein [Mesorhizobium sp. BAC0120]|uniref:adenylate/guanylate cyclase domain-containing protein n=1 Tax=Mesorhizobium sp. BAC0120 TaxID=3090670 RepID=UPI00298C8072|nr:adenylate/guanylate cyclase domain-containing protein [Mesorhizobium sp. BAC0120]MDW6020882.1 adenylate/guanylate cyclase domain-containing protein [Mesorhizobium sp. BAC0120]